MNKKEYAEYEENVERGLEGLRAVSSGPCPTCEECGLEDIKSYDDDPERYEMAGEPHFSWFHCDCCSSSLGGDRYPAHGIDQDGDIIHLDVCPDCYYYIVYGHLDDMTMMEIEAS